MSHTPLGEEDLWTLTRHGDASTDSVDVLIEVPHGATETAHFDRLHDRLRGPFPADLASFFHVNTDVGAPECARFIADSLASRGLSVRVLRCLIPRTFIDCNREIDHGSGGRVVDGLTPGLPGYVTDHEDSTLLTGHHERYQCAAGDLFRSVCGNGGVGLILHTYAPRSVAIDRVDDDIVTLLRHAYTEEQFKRWPERPPVDLISRTEDDRMLAPEGLVGDLLSRYRDTGISATENATYRLHPGTTGHGHSQRYPGQVVCLEFNRGRLGDPWIPFEPVAISSRGVDALSTPLVEALSNWFGDRGGG